MFRRYVILALIGGMLSSSQVFAQEETGARRGPSTPLTGRNVTALGVTKPPAREASPAKLAVVGKRTPRERQDDAITRSICTGCD